MQRACTSNVVVWLLLLPLARVSSDFTDDALDLDREGSLPLLLLLTRSLPLLPRVLPLFRKLSFLLPALLPLLAPLLPPLLVPPLPLPPLLASTLPLLFFAPPLFFLLLLAPPLLLLLLLLRLLPTELLPSLSLPPVPPLAPLAAVEAIPEWANDEAEPLLAELASAANSGGADSITSAVY